MRSLVRPLLLGSALLAVWTAPAWAATEPWQAGANFTAWWHDTYEQPAADTALRGLAATGTRRVAIVTTWYMSSPVASDIQPIAQKTPSDASLLHAMSTARTLGMEVVLKPHVDVANGSFRADVAPTDRAAWFDAYRRMTDHYAGLAAAGDAQMLIVGTELTSMSADEAEWRRVIAGARARFGGALTFAANWIDGARQVAFWDALDYVGIDAYMPLADAPGATTDTLVAAWRDRGYVRDLEDLHARTGKPVLFTELGYQSRAGTAVTPWGGARGAIDQDAQARAYEAAFRAFWDQPWFAGIYWWDWSAAGPGDPGGHPFAGKAAEGVVTSWNARARPDIAPPAPPPVAAAPTTSAPTGFATPVAGSASIRAARVKLRLTRRRRLEGSVRRRAEPCNTQVTVRVRRLSGRRHGARWKSATAPTTRQGNFRVAVRGLGAGRYQADARAHGGPCGSARSVRLAFRLR